MKKVILFSCLFGLISNVAFATYYKTTTEYCGDANMLAELDSAVATHRAVITEIDCDYVKPVAPKKHATQKPAPKRKVAAKKYVHHAQHRAPKPQPIVVEYVPAITVVQITTTETCTCFDCGC